jgi:hypothetical protein
MTSERTLDPSRPKSDYHFQVLDATVSRKGYLDQTHQRRAFRRNFFDGTKIHLIKELIAHLDELVARVSLDLEPSSTKNEEVLEVDEEVLYPEHTETRSPV